MTTASPQPQPVVMPLTESAMFLILTVDDGGEDVVHDFMGGLSGLIRSVGFRVPPANLTCVAGIGSGAWDRLFDGPRPAELHPFAELTGERHHAPSTPGDLHFHIRSRQMDMCFELATKIVDALAGAATVVDEVHGFKFFDNRDLMGFVDGTENPSGARAYSAVTVGDEDPDFTGSSYVIVQKYLHDMAGWNSLTTEDQEKVIGRSKLDDIEMADDVKPADSHTALNVIVDDNGVQQQILRDNMPFGQVGTAEYGTYFIGYSKSPAVTEEMLENMFVGKPPGNTDRILEFSTAHTGCLFFVPTVDFLDDPPDRPDTSPTESLGATAEPTTRTTADESLGIGSLRRS